MSLILYTSSRVLVSVIGCDPHWGYLMIVVIGLVTTTYTLIGGIRTVMITEALQFFIMLLGATLYDRVDSRSDWAESRLGGPATGSPIGRRSLSSA